MTPNYCAAIGYLKRNQLNNEFQQSLETLRIIDGAPGGPNVFGNREFRPREISKIGNYRVDRERNTVVEALLREPRAFDGRPLDRFLLLDDDHSWLHTQPYELLDLVSPERPVVSGLYFAVESKNAEKPYVRPLVFRYPKAPNGVDDRNTYLTLYNYPRNALVEVHHIGLGFCAIWRELLEEWQRAHGPTWFDFGHRPNGRHIIEDEAFCRRVLHEMNRPIFVHTGICVKHWKQWGFDESFFDAQTALYEKQNKLLVPDPNIPTTAANCNEDQTCPVEDPQAPAPAGV
jgi:hypothetical protein